MPPAHRFTYLTPHEGEPLADFLQRAAGEHHWPTAHLEEDVALLRGMLGRADSKAAPGLAAYLVRALSFAADPSMALRHFSRYLQAVGPRAQGQLHQLTENIEHLHFLCSLFAFSNYLSEVAIQRPDFLDWVFSRSRLNREKSLEIYRQQLEEFRQNEQGPLLEVLTRFKKRELLRIGIRDMREMAGVRELCRELSNLAQAILEIVTAHALEQATAYYGAPRCHAYNRPVDYCVYAMGKFGAGELNFSSDVDLIFVYDEEGKTEGVPEGLGGAPVRVASNHEYFNKVSRDIMQALGNSNAEGFLFRADARLRPEGVAGPLSRSRSAYSAYFATQAGLWEKLPYMKARFVSGAEELASLFDPIVHQFVWTQSSADLLFREIARLKKRIDFDALNAVGRELDIKRGRGGIREIEFIVAGLQLLHAPSHPQLRVRPTLEAAELLSAAGLLDKERRQRLEAAYLFFRRVEHTLQMLNEAQTHTLPGDSRERRVLALRCGFLDPAEFEQLLASHRDYVRGCFEELFHADNGRAQLTLVDYLFGETDPPDEVVRALGQHGLESRAGFQLLRQLAVGTREHTPSARARQDFEAILPNLLAELPLCAQPEQAVRQFHLLLQAARGYGWVYEFCVSHPPILKLFLRTLGFGSFLGRLLIAHPEWLDEIFQNRGLSEGRTVQRLAEENLAFPQQSSEEAWKRLRRFKRLEGFLISTQEILAIAPSEQAAARMANLASAVLRAATARTLADLQLALPGRWVLLGLGGLGDRQVHFQGDLDIALVVEPESEKARHAMTEQSGRFANTLIKNISALTPDGQLWKVDARLRPDGASGPLAAERARLLDYYQREAGLWEWQVLTKARAIAGDLAFGEEVLQELYALAPRALEGKNIAAEVWAMRGRMESAAKLPGHATADLKLSPGGVVDVEFLVQALQLRHADRAPELFPLTTEEALRRFTEEGLLPEGGELQRHLRLLRVTQRALRLLFETAHDYLPSQEPKAAALRRGVQEQLILQRLGWPSDWPSELRRARQLVRDAFGRL